MQPSRAASLLAADIHAVTSEIPVHDETACWATLVGSVDQGNHPVHRWMRYREAFSPELPPKVAYRFGVGTGTVVDPFAGVATTQLGLRGVPGVRRAIGIEYSPLAHLVGSAKISALALDPDALAIHATKLSRYRLKDLEPPDLSSLRNPEIFHPGNVSQLLSAISAIRADGRLSHAERSFFLVGVAGVIEDASRVMKDGRALRILRGRRRRPTSFWPERSRIDGLDVRSLLRNQWAGMISDLRVTARVADQAELTHINGTALAMDRYGIDDHSVGLLLFSPPYLNALDYSEVYKLELWLLGLVSSQAEFRKLREGTLRSHPSIQFSDGPSDAIDDRVAAIAKRLRLFLEENHARPAIASIVTQYFADMRQVLASSLRLLEPGGRLVCIVGNSTFGRREAAGENRNEMWRLPIETDLLIAQLAVDLGFASSRVLIARELRARNVNNGTARESLVVAAAPV